MERRTGRELDMSGPHGLFSPLVLVDGEASLSSGDAVPAGSRGERHEQLDVAAMPSICCAGFVSSGNPRRAATSRGQTSAGSWPAGQGQPTEHSTTRGECPVPVLTIWGSDRGRRADLPSVLRASSNLPGLVAGQVWRFGLG